jgi:hypothetical protein
MRKYTKEEMAFWTDFDFDCVEDPAFSTLIEEHWEKICEMGYENDLPGDQYNLSLDFERA